MNNTIKKLIGLILIAANIISAFGISVIAERVEYEMSESVRVMDALEIMKTDGDAVGLKEAVTRGEFVKYLANVLNIKAAENPYVYFSDVPKSDPYCGILASLYELNIIKGSPSGNFESHRVITYEEAYKMIVESCGYGVLAELDGGYPMGYISVARRFGILAENVSGGELDFSECAEILYVACTNNLYDRTYGSGELGFFKTGETLLSKYHDVYTYEGEMQSVFGASVIDSSQIEPGNMVIGGELFRTEGSSVAFEDTAYLGSVVRGLYREDKSGIKKLFYVWEYDNNDAVTVSAEDYSGYKSYNLTYFDKNDRERTVTIDKGAVYICNGMRVDENISTLYEKFKQGSITLKKINDSESYNLVMIKSYENFIVGSYGEKTQIIAEYNNPVNTINLNNYEFIKYFDGDLAVDSLSYKPEMVLTVAKQGNVIEIHKNNQQITGEIKAVSTNGKRQIITIDDSEYEIDLTCYAEFKDKIKSGVICVVKLDLFGKIAYIDFDTSTDWNFAYLLRVGFKEGTFGEGENMIECYTQNGEFATFSFADKVEFDGNKRKGTENLTAYYPDSDLTDGEVPMQMIRYKLNGTGEIKVIDTTSQYGDAETSIREYGVRSDAKKIYAPNMGLFLDGANNQIAIDEKTIVMEVPGFNNSYSDIEKIADVYFEVYPITKLAPTVQRVVEGYAVGDEDIAPIVVLVDINIENDEYIEDAIIFESLGQDTDNNGDVYTTINGYTFRGNKISYLVTDDAVFTNISGLEEFSESDVVGIKTYTKDEKTYIRIIEKIYSDSDVNRDDPKTAWGWTGVVKDRMAWQNIRPDFSNFILGDVVKIKGNMLHLSTPGGEKVVELYNTTKAPIFVYDKNETGDKFYVGSLADIQARDTHEGQGSRVIIRRNQYTPEGLLLYK